MKFADLRKALPVSLRVPLRVYATAVVLVGMLGGFYFLHVRPRNTAMADERQEIQTRKATLQLLEVEMAKLEGAEQQLERLNRAVEAFETGLPRQGEIDVILREVWVIADAAGLKTQRIKTLKDRRQDEFKVLPIELSLRGPFAGVYSFLLSIERLPGVTKVESLKLVTLGETGEEVEASLILNVYCKD
ncbi:MAG: type 4a pilus biogenesis protein PilO [Planctomycetes bacterium]|nr:type 4a pilus biogenesis protein PilO [Planctomycetota bacterium]